jgi:sn-glycerol 3-phosphate transport system permease protein
VWTPDSFGQPRTLTCPRPGILNTRPLTVGLAIFGAPESGVDRSVISAGTLMAVAPLLVAFLLFQRQFMQSFMHAGIK